jgi:hypothetical protein
VQPAKFSDRLDHIFQMRLKKRHHSILQFRKLFGVAFTAENLVTDLRQAGRRRETHITRAND